MPRILAIDFGMARCGVAVTDPLQIIATALKTVPTKEIFDFLQSYFSNEEVESLVLGYPLNLDGNSTDATKHVEVFLQKLKELFPTKPIHLINEVYTSKLAMRTMIESGVRKKERRKKGELDKIAATIILQDFLEHRGK